MKGFFSCLTLFGHVCVHMFVCSYVCVHLHTCTCGGSDVTLAVTILIVLGALS